jgi:hypothetical protein
MSGSSRTVTYANFKAGLTLIARSTQGLKGIEIIKF